MKVASGLPLLEVDRTRIRQVILNLINNAVRATREGFIEVSATADEEQVIVCVRDSGEGIPPDRLEVIFEEFEQVDTSIRRPHQGVGLGLSICRHFVRLHGGRIWVESVPGEGSTFCFSLPLPGRRTVAQPVLPRRAWPSPPAEDRDRSTVLALCRDQLVGRMLERHAEGLEVVSTASWKRRPTDPGTIGPDNVGVEGPDHQWLVTGGRLLRPELLAVASAEVPALVAAFPPAAGRSGAVELLLGPSLANG